MFFERNKIRYLKSWVLVGIILPNFGEFLEKYPVSVKILGIGEGVR